MATPPLNSAATPGKKMSAAEYVRFLEGGSPQAAVSAPSASANADVSAPAGSEIAQAPPADQPPLIGGVDASSLYKNQAKADDGADEVGAAGQMIGFSHSDGSGTQTITLVHTGKSWMAVYHIDRSGQIRLVSSRPIDDDFSLLLNATSPTPSEIRGMNSVGK
ncbi:hypothetical protein [Stieleria varia]|uniref:hypothetical protein n=1 Tax=Stieleria varia TaxID=2528005 RepID=UPI0011B4D9CE|nr:hypothetical protein [Stieleria varia]